MKKEKVYSYHTSHKFKDKKGVEHSFVTQLYQTGIYGIFDGRPDSQYNLTPNQLVSMEKKLRKLEENKEITDLEFGIPIRVTKDKNGFYIKVENDG